jgi:5'-phosphate synthase pdxT subunit
LTKATVGVLALQGDFREHAAILEECGARVVRVRLPEDLDGLQGLVVPGGESTTMSKLLTSSVLVEPLLEAIEHGLACLTTCAGTILAAREIRDGIPDQVSLDILDIVVRRNAYGRQLQSAEVSLEIPAVGTAPVPVAFIRAPSIEEVGAGVEVLASYQEQAAAVRQGAHIGLTFHPELTGDTRLHRLFLSAL